jgi:hypothetical protein
MQYDDVHDRPYDHTISPPKSTTTITVERGETFRRFGRRPWRTDYRCTGPDGTVFTNTDKADLKSVLTRRYGRVNLVIVDGPTWRKQP